MLSLDLAMLLNSPISYDHLSAGSGGHSSQKILLSANKDRSVLSFLICVRLTSVYLFSYLLGLSGQK